MLRKMLSYMLSVTDAVTGATPAAPGEGRSPKWPGVRAAHLKREPACAACGTTDHLQVHHVLPFAWPGGAALELIESNLLTLCESPSRNCHLNWGHLGDFKSRNPTVREDAARWLQRIRTRPMPAPSPTTAP